MIPVEVGIPTYQVSNYDPDQNYQERRAELDLIEEKRESASMRNRNYQRLVERYYNSRVKTKRFAVSDLVLRENMPPGTNSTEGKLQANWEGLYKVMEVM